MTRPFPLQTLQNLSELRLDTATRRLGELIAGEQEAARRHELLVEYRAEYQTRFVAAAQGGLGPTEWRNFQSFFAKLDEAIAQANLMVSQSRDRTVQGQQEWISKRGDVKAYETLAARHRQKQTTLDVRLAQFELDEFALRPRDDNDDAQR